MTTKTVARCGIYEDRPKVCSDYPKIDHYIPSVCTYYFKGPEREGDCACDEGACCAIPRAGGEPGGTPLPEIAGGSPCKHLVWEEVVEKSASALPILNSSPNRNQLMREALGDTGRDSS